jgi:transposase InsO family protein
MRRAVRRSSAAIFNRRSRIVSTCAVAHSVPARASRRVTRVLDEIIAERGKPVTIRCDSGPELTSRHFLAWCIERQIELLHIQPGRPMQNGRVESFHGKLRDECLRVSWFGNLFEARRKIAGWRTEYNQERPHSSLGYRTPEEFAREMRDEEGCGKDGGFAPLENASRFPLSHSHGDGVTLTNAEQFNGPEVVS